MFPRIRLSALPQHDKKLAYVARPAGRLERSTLPDHKSQIWGAAIELPRVKVTRGSGAHVSVAVSVGAARFLSALNAALQHSRGDRANRQNNAREVAWEGPGKLLRSAPFLSRNAPEGIQACVGNGRLEHGYGFGGTMRGRTECRGKFEDRGCGVGLSRRGWTGPGCGILTVLPKSKLGLHRDGRLGIASFWNLS